MGIPERDTKHEHWPPCARCKGKSFYALKYPCIENNGDGSSQMYMQGVPLCRECIKQGFPDEWARLVEQGIVNPKLLQ